MSNLPSTNGVRTTFSDTNHDNEDTNSKTDIEY